LLVSPARHSESSTKIIFSHVYLPDDTDSDDPVDSEDDKDSDVAIASENSWKEALSGSCCKQWFITMERPALGSTSMQKMEYYNKALTSVVGR
ncbi:hypothetical protein FRX31_009126, partial [Thalictrum thalictroides]